MPSFLVALQFLTRVPVPAKSVSERDVASSYLFYPLVGLLLGLAAVVVRHVSAIVFPGGFTIVLMLTFLAWITGGLHEDGLADVADGMGGGWTREDRLRIMKDSRIGAFGTLALISVILAKYTALTSMNGARLDAAVISAQTLGRWAFLPLGYFNPPAGAGLGAKFMKSIALGGLILTTVFTAAAIMFLGRSLGMLALGGATAIIAGASGYFRRRLGGVTGDCFGATFQFVEVMTYAIFLT